MGMDAENPVVALCAEGMAAEADGRDGDARDLFARAWDAARDDYEACVAAHYVARHQDTADDRLAWNAESLARAERVGDDRVAGFFSSLHVNLARAHADLGDPATARVHYGHAAGTLDAVPPGPYRDWTRYAIANGLRTTAAPAARATQAATAATNGTATAAAAESGAEAAGAPDAISALVDALCARRDLVALAVLLPPYVGDLGTDSDRQATATALHMLHASPELPAAERALVRGALAAGPSGAA